MIGLLTLPMPLLSTGTSGIDLLLLGLISMAVGVLSGLVGMPLSIVRLPVLLAFGFNPLIAAGTNLAVSVMGAVAGGWTHLRGGRVVMKAVLVMGFPALVGSFIGGHYADIAPAWLLLGFVGVFLLWSAVVTLVRTLQPANYLLANGDPDDPSGSRRLVGRRLYTEGTIGLMFGMIGGAVGLVLGSVRMPALVNTLRMAPAMAAGTNTMIGILAGTLGFAGHLLNGRVDWAVLGAMGAGAIVGSLAGAQLTGRVNPFHLRILIGVVLLLIAPPILYEAVRAFGR